MATIINLVPDMTSDTTPSGVVSASGFSGSGAEPFRAFDRNTSTYWNSGDIVGWLQYEFPTAEICTGYSMLPYFADISPMPKDFTFEASDTGLFTGEEVVLDTQTGITWVASTKQTFSFTNTTAYKYYRIVVTANNGDPYSLYMAEAEFLKTIYTRGTASVSIGTTGKAVSKAVSNASVSIGASASGQTRKAEHLFFIVGNIEFNRTTQNFSIIGAIEQTAPSINIQRVNV